MTKRVTLATVAQALGVSAMTVSNAYNRPEKLSEELRERVLAKAAELGYSGPNPIARSLRRGHAGALGVVLGETLPYAFEDPGAVEFLRGLAGAVVASGTALHLVPVGGGARDPALVLDAAVDAFVLFAVPDDHPVVDPLLQRNIPLVVQGGPELPGHPLVSVDEESAAKAAVRHLQALGHTRLGAITIPLCEFDARADRDVPPDAGANMRVSRLRLAGYRAAAPGIAIREAASNSRDRGEAAAHVLLDLPDPPTAIACMSDELAIGALRAASARGVGALGGRLGRHPRGRARAADDDPPVAV